MKLLLQHKILVGYFLLMAIIGSMVAIVLHERNRVHNIENELLVLYQTQSNINTAHRYVTILATYGESVIAWDKDDCGAYHDHRLKADSLLLVLRKQCKDFIHPTQIDTLRSLLESKEECLFRLMKVFQQQEETDSLLLNQLQTVSAKAIQSCNITRKKKDIAGFFGAKETVQIPFHTLDKELISLQGEGQKAIDTYTSSLRLHNRELNRKFRTLITNLDEQALTAIKIKEEKIKASYDRSVAIITGLIFFATLLLAISYLIIQRDIRAKVRHDKRMEVTVKDLQENIQENRRLIEARRRIIQTVTHELRTPLAAIVGNAELIESDKKADRLRHLDSIQQSAKRMVSLLTNLMNYFRLDSGKELADPKPFHLRSIADILFTEFTPQTEAKQLAFQVNNCKDGVVIGDKDLILRIGSNLLSNAVKFTERGRISLSASCENGTFIMVVEDTGSGITKEQQERIFRPFERLTNAATQDGFGLGLPIVRELVELMKGELSLESIPGKGSRFCVKLPLEQADETNLNNDKTQVAQPLYNGSVLVLDNDEILLSMTRDMLIRQKIDCDTCRNVRELLKKMRVKNYDLLITDMKMPDMNGYEVMELLRTSDIGNSRSIPIIVSTAMDRNAEAELLAAGFCGCLFKPFSSGEVALAIATCIDYSEQRQKIDLSTLLAYGNKEDILKRLITETEKEMKQVREAFEKKDIAELDTLIHHLRSSWILLNADRPLRKLYDLIHQSKHDEILLNESVQAVLRNGANIIRLAQKTKEGLWER